MLENITVTNEKNEETKKLVGRKPAKLSAIQIFRTKAEAMKKSVVNTKQTETKIPEAKEETEKPVVVSDIVFPNADECQRRLDNKMVSCTEISEINKINSARKLRAAVRVPKLVGYIYKNRTKKVPQELSEKTVNEEANVYDFSKSFEKMTETTKEEPQQEEVPEKPYSWLRNEESTKVLPPKEEVNEEESSDVVEYQTLMEQKETTADSLATQKEILMNLRKQVEHNNRLCEAKKRDLIEENMALTQELNDVLAEINRLSDTVNQQEAFLGISEDNKTR